VNPCYYHPDAVADAICVKCGMPICKACTQVVGVKSSGPSCVDFVRLHASPSATSTAPSAAAAQTPTWSAEHSNYKTERDTSYYGQMLAGLGLGLLIGSVLSIAVMKVYFYAHFGMSLLYIFIGYGVGFGIH